MPPSSDPSAAARPAAARPSSLSSSRAATAKLGRDGITWEVEYTSSPPKTTRLTPASRIRAANAVGSRSAERRRLGPPIHR